MILKINKEIKHILSINDNKSMFLSESKIESSTDIAIADGFKVLEVETKIFQLGESNTFNKDVFAILKTLKSDITFIDISCYLSGESYNKTPIRFDVEVATTVLFRTSDFNISNVESNSLADLTIKNIVVPVGKIANLQIIVGSKNNNE